MPRSNPANTGEAVSPVQSERDGRPVYESRSARSFALLEHRVTTIERKNQSMPLTSFYTAKSTAAQDIDADFHSFRDWCDQLELRLSVIEKDATSRKSENVARHGEVDLSSICDTVDSWMRESSRRLARLENQIVETQDMQDAEVSSAKDERRRDRLSLDTTIQRLDEERESVAEQLKHIQTQVSKVSDKPDAVQVDSSVLLERLNDLEGQLEAVQRSLPSQQSKEDHSNVLNRLNELEAQIKKVQNSRKPLEADSTNSQRIKQLEMLLEMLQAKRSQADEARDTRLKKLEGLIRPFEKYQAEVQSSVKQLSKMQEVVKTYVEKGDVKADITREVSQAVKDDRDEFYQAIRGCENDIRVLTQWVHKLHHDAESVKPQQVREAGPPGVMSTTALAESLAERILRGEDTEMEAMKTLSHALDTVMSRVSKTVDPTQLPHTPDGSTDNQADDIDRTVLQWPQGPLTAILRDKEASHPTTGRASGKPASASVSFDESTISCHSPSEKAGSRKRRRAPSTGISENEVRRTSRTHVPTRRAEEYEEELRAGSVRSRR